MRAAIRAAAGQGAAVAVAEDAWDAASGLLERGDVSTAAEELARASVALADARERRDHELRDALTAAEDHISLARMVGADPSEAQKVLEEARDAMDRLAYAAAGDLAKRAERMAMQDQLAQIRRAMQLRDSQLDKALAIIVSNEATVKEAEAYGLSAMDARTLLRQARDVLGRGDYVAGSIFVRNAEEAVVRLEPLLVEERRRRGIAKPVGGVCVACRSAQVQFYDNGWGHCLDCGESFRWHRAPWLRTALRGLLRE